MLQEQEKNLWEKKCNNRKENQIKGVELLWLVIDHVSIYIRTPKKERCLIYTNPSWPIARFLCYFRGLGNSDLFNWILY